MVTGAVASMVSAQASVLRHTLATIKGLDTEIGNAADAHPRAHLLESLPRVGRLNLAQIIGEVGPVLDSAVDVDHACAQVGATPVTGRPGRGSHQRARTAISPHPAIFRILLGTAESTQWSRVHRSRRR
jgi:transposase